MANIEIYTLGKNGVEHTFEINFDYTINNDGIGPYEYWGTRGFDHGADYLDQIHIREISLVRETPLFNQDGSRKKDSRGIGRYKRSLRSIDKNKLTAVSLENVEEKILENFDWQSDIKENRYSF